MLCVTVIGLAALSLASLGFFVWCWLHFKDESESHPIYRANQLFRYSAANFFANPTPRRQRLFPLHRDKGGPS